MAAPELAWNPLVLLGLPAGLASLAFGLYVFGVRRTFQNRTLGAFLVLWGAMEVASNVRFLLVDAHDAYAAWVVRHASLPLLSATLLAFYSSLPTRWVAPLRPVAVRVALFTAAFVVVAFEVTNPSLLASGMAYSEPGRVWVANSDGVLWAPPVILLAVLSILGAPLTLLAMREARAQEERRKLKALATAFTVNALFMSVSLATLLSLRGGTDVLTLAFNFGLLPLGNLVFVLFLAYGMIRSQLLGAELRLKWTLSRGTTAAIFIGVFFVVSEGAQRVFEQRYGPVFGLAGAGLLVFALAPLQRAADRIADRAMPEVRDTPEYRERRGRAIYRAAVESAARDGVVTDKERDMLATLQVELGIPATEALAMEREVVRAAT